MIKKSALGAIRLFAACLGAGLVLSAMTCANQLAEAQPTSTSAGPSQSPAGAVQSVEFGHLDGPYGVDHAVSSIAPAGGFFFSAWTRLPADWQGWGHNMDVLVLRGDNWYMRCLVGNVGILANNRALYNANSMVFTELNGLWAGDYSYYNTPSDQSIPLTRCTDWVWVAWQVVVEPAGLTIRQWLKFGMGGPVIQAWDIGTSQTGTDHVSFAALRAFIMDPANNPWHASNGKLLTQAQADAWVPGPVRSFQIGNDNSNLTHVRVASRSDQPSLAELDAIATRAAPDPTAWADYALEWRNGAADLADRSGHGHDLSPKAGARFLAGQAGPVYP